MPRLSNLSAAFLRSLRAMTLVVWLVSIGSLSAQDESPKPIDLLQDGMSSWHVAGCTTSLEDGVLKLVDGDGFARVAWELKDFEFEFEWRPLKESKFDSGIYFRAPDPAGSPWPRQYQINLLEGGEGNLIGNDSGKAPAGLIKAGEWNRMKLRVVGDTATLWLNGEKAWEVSGLDTTPGYLGLQSEVPLGGQFEFRHMMLTELDSKPTLNSGLEGWTVVTSTPEKINWVIENEILKCLGGGNDWLRFDQPMNDVNLRLEYRVGERGNSGIYVRVPEDGNHHGDGAGLEVQILDDAGHANDQLKPYQFSASLYDFAGANPQVCRPLGEWNVLELQVTGDRYRIRHNGETVVDVRAGDVPGLSARRTEGYLGLQNHGEGVEFRRIRWVE